MDLSEHTRFIIPALGQHLRRGLGAFGVPPPMTLDEWARAHFYLSAESSYVEQRWTPWWFQRAIMSCISNDDIYEINWRKSARVGYALALDTPVPTVAGWSTMGDLQPGDHVFDETGKQCTVRYVSPIYADHECFEITFCDGTSVVADRGHRWNVESDQTFEYLRGELGNGKIGRLRADQSATFCGIVDTGEMYAMQHTASGRNALAISNAGAIELPEIKLPIPPYTLGVWLGDGHLVTPRITKHRGDVEVADYIRAEGIAVDVRYIDARHTDNATLFLDVPSTGRPVSPWASVFRKLGLLKAKHIPADYLRASKAQRIALLRGLMDTDGTIGKNGRCEFNNTNEAVARGAYELIVSLGMKATLHTRAAKHAHHLMQYRIGFKPTPDCNPFNLSRKAARVIPAAKPTITHRRRIASIKPVPSVPVRCIEVDSANSLFLCTRAMVPTHNTKIILAAIGYFAQHKRRNQVLWQPTDDDRDEFVKTELDPMLRDVAVMESVFPVYLKRDKDNTLQAKKFMGSALHMKGGKAAKNYRRISADVGYQDELDAFDANIEKEGDSSMLAAKRLEGATFPKFIAGTTPKLKGFSNIEKREREADLFMRAFIPCPECGGYHPLTFGGKDEPHGFKWVDNDPETAKHLCPHCGALITQAQYLSMNLDALGRYQAEDGTTLDNYGVFRNASGEIIRPPRHIAFHVWSAYSPNVSWAGIVRDFLAAVRESGEGKKEKLQVFTNTTLGEYWAEEYEKTDENELRARAEPFPLERVPRGAVLLLAGLDTQPNRIECAVWGYGRGCEMWSVAHRVFFGNPDEEEVWADVDEFLFETEFMHASGARMRVHGAAIDTKGHNTHAVYNWVAKYSRRKVFAIGGRSGREKHIKDGASKVDIDWKGRTRKNGLVLWWVGTNHAKDLLYGRMQITKPGPGYVHFSSELSDEWFRQFTGEARTTRRTTRGDESSWTATRKRVEAWDCGVYTIWLETYFELGKKSAKFWDDLEAKIQPMVGDLFDTPEPAESSAQVTKAQPFAPLLPAERAGARQPGAGSGAWL